MLRDLAIVLSLANLCFFGVWSELLPGYPGHYHMVVPPPPFAFAAAILNVSVLAALFWGGMLFVRQSRRPYLLNLARWSFLAVFLVVANSFRGKIPALTVPNLSALFGATGLKAFGVVIAVTALLVLVRWHRRVVHVAAAIVLVLFAFVLLTFSRAGWSLMNPQSAFAKFAPKPPAPLLTVKRNPAPRVLWLVFDEMDQRLTFLERPSIVKLAEIDRFRSQALYASNAYPPANDTLLSMPALITGRPIAEAWPVDADELSITFADGKNSVSWSTQPNIFGRARELGFQTAALGWYHPYCRVIGNSLTTCAFYWWGNTPESTMSDSISNQLIKLVGSLPLQRHLRLTESFQHWLQPESVSRAFTRRVSRYLRMREDAHAIATDSHFGLILLHWPIPHPPGIYDRSKKDFAWEGGRSYLDNLELVDLSLGELRRIMETAGNWDTTAVLITSDHSYRIRTSVTKRQTASEEETAVDGKIDRRVPFLLKLSGQKKAVTYDYPFNTVLTHDMILALLRSEISDPESLVAWLDRHRSSVPSPRRPIN